MKNNKTKTYVLLAAVLGIWGTIAYKILNGLNPDIPPEAVSNDIANFEPKEIVPIDSFEIQTLDRDPFLGIYRRKQDIKPRAKKKMESLPPEMNISYGGLIQKKGTREKIFVVNINGNQYLMKKGQEVAGVKLIRGTKASITIRYGNMTKTINQ